MLVHLESDYGAPRLIVGFNSFRKAMHGHSSDSMICILIDNDIYTSHGHEHVYKNRMTNTVVANVLISLVHKTPNDPHPPSPIKVGAARSRVGCGHPQVAL